MEEERKERKKRKKEKKERKKERKGKKERERERESQPAEPAALAFNYQWEKEKIHVLRTRRTQKRPPTPFSLLSFFLFSFFLSFFLPSFYFSLFFLSFLPFFFSFFFYECGYNSTKFFPGINFHTKPFYSSALMHAANSRLGK